jgi:hypothetical protein
MVYKEVVNKAIISFACCSVCIRKLTITEKMTFTVREVYLDGPLCEFRHTWQGLESRPQFLLLL